MPDLTGVVSIVLILSPHLYTCAIPCMHHTPLLPCIHQCCPISLQFTSQLLCRAIIAVLDRDLVAITDCVQQRYLLTADVTNLRDSSSETKLACNNLGMRQIYIGYTGEIVTASSYIVVLISLSHQMMLLLCVNLEY